LSDLVLDFDIEAIGFEPPEIDLRIQSLDSALEEADNQFELATGPVVSRTGDLWLLGSHRLYCGSALDATSYDALSNGERAAAAITDPPYNVKIDGHVSGNGRTTHREFAMASVEMSEAEFSDFLQQTFQRISAYCRDGALIYSFMDWRHMSEILAAGRAASLDLLNLCVWAKTNGGMRVALPVPPRACVRVQERKRAAYQQHPTRPLRQESVQRLEFSGGQQLRA
jgi:hypothetical protein